MGRTIEEEEASVCFQQGKGESERFPRLVNFLVFSCIVCILSTYDKVSFCLHFLTSSLLLYQVLSLEKIKKKEQWHALLKK